MASFFILGAFGWLPEQGDAEDVAFGLGEGGARARARNEMRWRVRSADRFEDVNTEIFLPVLGIETVRSVPYAGCHTQKTWAAT